MDGALTTHPKTLAVPPLRNASASSMQSPPTRAEATRGNCSDLVGRIGRKSPKEQRWTSFAVMLNLQHGHEP